MTDFFFSPLLQ